MNTPMTKTPRQPFGEGANKAGREVVKKMEADLKSKESFEGKMKDELARRGVSQEWMKNQLIITKV
jgi:hypothetical protein